MYLRNSFSFHNNSTNTFKHRLDTYWQDQLSMIFMHSYREPEVVVVYLHTTKLVMLKWKSGGHRGLGLRLLFRYVYVTAVLVETRFDYKANNLSGSGFARCF